MNFFGTDGIRGTYGSTVTDGTAFLLGKSLALLGGSCPIILICRDTRTSGDSLFNALAHGIYQGGGNVINLGILPTNAVGHFVRKFGGDFGVMITASHNPPQDNGLKVFDSYGVKLCKTKQIALSKMMSELAFDGVPKSKIFEPVFYSIESIYCRDILQMVKADLAGIKVCVDCCYGAGFRVARKLFQNANADVTCLCDRNNGAAINVDCGATHTNFLAENIAGRDFDLAFSLDGDADRLAVFEGEREVSNNRVFFAFAKYFHEQNNLRNNTVCGTVLTNGGVEKALGSLGITLVRSDVGDVNVFNMMVERGLNLGGEESGHYLLCDYATASDALLNALVLCKIFREKGSLLDYTKECVDLPFSTANIALTQANDRLSEPQSLAVTATRVKTLFPNCRLVLRKSGTENKVRAYAEGADCKQAIDCVVATFSQTPHSAE